MTEGRLAAWGTGTDDDPDIVSRKNVQRLFDAVATASAGLACLIAALTLTGWAWDISALRSPGSPVPPMMPHVAVSLLGLGAALVLLRAPPGRIARRVGHVLAAVAALVAGAACLSALLSLEPRLDRTLFFDVLVSAGYPDPGRISVASTIAVVLLGVALAIYDLAPERVHRAAELLVMAVALVGLVALVRYAFLPLAYEATGANAVSVHTAVALLALACGSVLLRTDRGWLRILANPATAGIALRRLLPVAIAGPLLIGWLTFVGVTGDLVAPLTGLTLFMSLVSVLLLVAVAWTIGELDRMDRERTELLRSERQARAEAEEANGAKSKFLAVMSHELRTPLNGILAYADLLDMASDELSERQHHHVKRIWSSGRHLKSMIEEILAFARIQSGSPVLDTDIRRADAVRLANDALALVEHEVDKDAVEIVRQLPSEPLEIETDPDKVLHVLVNLLGNAVKFTERGRIGIRLSSEGEDVMFDVWDTGPGIPSDDQEKIFQEFTQLEGPVRRSPGVGLGLAIARSHATGLGGRLEVRSWLGRGSVFRLVVPRRTRSARASGRGDVDGRPRHDEPRPEAAEGGALAARQERAPPTYSRAPLLARPLRRR